jgi:hypothetical protein
MSFAKIRIDHLRRVAESLGLRWSMSDGRNCVARLLYGRPYASVIAAENAGVLGRSAIHDDEARSLGKRFGILGGSLVESARYAVLEEAEWADVRRVSSTTDAVRAGTLPALPEVSQDMLRRAFAEVEASGGTVQAVTLNPWNLRSGHGDRFVSVGHAVYALEDQVLATGEAFLTIEMNGTVFRRFDAWNPDGTHDFLALCYSGGEWSLRWFIHRLVDEDDMSMSYQQRLDRQYYG